MAALLQDLRYTLRQWRRGYHHGPQYELKPIDPAPNRTGTPNPSGSRREFPGS